jgi:ABC-type transport system involved in multi-copper enzyme maturation permease subunit
MSALTSRLGLGRRMPSIALPSGITAIIVKELRGRMRGRRAFIILTLYVLLLAAFAWMSQQVHEAQVAGTSSYGGQATYGSATVGRGIFGDLLMLQTLMIAVLAPAATAGAISSEREHQTLDLLAMTPISSLAIVLGKLLSALAWVFVLILASIPVTALVFVFGGVAPDDVVRGYAVLFATVIGLGSIGIFFSALTRRTGAATGLTFVVTIALVLGSQYLFDFLSETAKTGSNGLREQPPALILYLNPFVAQADVSCGTEDGGFGGRCQELSNILTPTDFPVAPGIDPTKPADGSGAGTGVAPGFPADPDTDGAGPGPEVNVGDRGGGVDVEEVAALATTDAFRDRFWPKTVTSFLILAAILTTISVQFVSPTRRWRPSLPGPVRRLIRWRSAP